MAAYAFVTLCRLWEARHHPTSEGLVALTCNEIARLFHALFRSESTQEHTPARSVFRRSHQAQARNCHYRSPRIMTNRIYNWSTNLDLS